MALASIAASIVAGCAADSETDGTAPATSADEIVVADIDLGGYSASSEQVASPDGRYVFFTRPVGRNEMELVRVDLSVSPAKTEVVQKVSTPSPDLVVSPKGTYVAVIDRGWHRAYAMTWDLTVRRELRGFESLTFSDDDRWLSGLRSSRLAIDGSPVMEMNGHALELATGKETLSQGRAPTYDVALADRPAFARDGKTVLLRLSDRVFGMDLETGAFSTLFSGIDRAEPYFGTFDGDSMLIATFDRNATWGAHRLVLVRRDGTSSPITDEKALYAALGTSDPHCIEPRGDGIFVMMGGANGGDVALATWDRASGLVTVRDALGARPDRGGVSGCHASVARDGTSFSFAVTNPTANEAGFATIELDGSGGATQRYVGAPGRSAYGFFDDGETAGLRENAAIHVVSLRDGSSLGTVPEAQWLNLPRVGDDFLTIEDGNTAVYRTGKATHTEVFRTTEHVSGVMKLGTNRAAAKIWRSGLNAKLVVFTL